MLYYINVISHVLAAMLWLGGMFFLALVGAPVLRTVEPPQLRAMLFQQLGIKFRTVGWTAVTVLLITGTLNLYFRGMLTARLFDGAFWATRYGNILAWKLSAVFGMLLIQVFHDFYLGPRAGQAVPGSADAIRLRSRAAWLARISALFGVAIVIAAVYLARAA